MSMTMSNLIRAVPVSDCCESIDWGGQQIKMYALKIRIVVR